MIPFVLSPAPASCYYIYSNISTGKKPTPGKQIVNDLVFSLLLSTSLFMLVSPYPQLDFLNWFGCPITVENYGAILSCSSVIFVLYIGPLVQTAFIEDEGQEFNLPELKLYVTDAFMIEAIFRTCTINLVLLSGFGFSSSVVISSLIYTWYQTRHYFQGLTLQNAIKHGTIGKVIHEITFTLAFSVFLGYMYVRTASYLAVVCVHIFKNFMGFPDLGFVFSSHRLYKYRFYILLAYIVGIVGGSYLFKLILMDPELFTPWLATLAY